MQLEEMATRLETVCERARRIEIVLGDINKSIRRQGLLTPIYDYRKVLFDRRSMGSIQSDNGTLTQNRFKMTIEVCGGRWKGALKAKVPSLD
jgi:hypothetical protein